MKKKKKEKLYRYTSLPVLLDLLHRKKIVLLDPKTWDDRNDSFFLEQYKTKSQLNTLLALCFTKKPDTYHHWKIFSGGIDGVRITFFEDEFLKVFNNNPNIIMDEVKYKKIKKLKEETPKLSELPFLKRIAFKDEKEFRIIYQDKDQLLLSKEFSINLSCISRVTVSPWIPKPILNSLKKTIKSIDDCQKIPVS